MISVDDARKWVKPRVSKKRFAHVEGVADVGRKLCALAAVPTYRVELACWLHDACKEMKEDDLLAMARAAGRVLTEEEERQAHLLHGPVAALVVRKELGIDDEEILAAIAEHTLGSLNMCQTSKLVYLADKLEASRPKELTMPIWEALGVIPPSSDAEDSGLSEKPGRHAPLQHATKAELQLNFDRAIFTAMNLVLAKLVKKEKPIQQSAIAIRNHFLQLSIQSEL